MDKANGWLKDYSLTNVAVFDFYNVLTTNGGNPDTNDLNLVAGNHHRWWENAIQEKTDGGSNVLAYRTGDDHPSAAGDQKARKEFVPLLNIFYHRWKNAGTGTPTPVTPTSTSTPVPPTLTSTATRTSVPVTLTSTATRTLVAASLTPTVTQTPGSSWIFCGDEGKFCSFSGTKNVRYGALGLYNYKTLTNGSDCSNGVFGDPIVQILKQCYYWNTLATPTIVP
jgi:hypothetical protein